MQITIRYFALLREQRGLEIEILPLTNSLTVFELFVQIFGREPIGIRFAVNAIYVSSDYVLVDGDEVAFLPPMGGG